MKHKISNSLFIAVSNKKYKRIGVTRHHNNTCHICYEKKKNIMYHYRKYHPEVLENIEKTFNNGKLVQYPVYGFFYIT